MIHELRIVGFVFMKILYGKWASTARLIGGRYRFVDDLCCSVSTKERRGDWEELRKRASHILIPKTTHSHTCSPCPAQVIRSEVSLPTQLDS